MDRRKKILIGVIVLLILAFFALDLGRYFSLAYLNEQKAALLTYQEAHPGKALYSIY